MTNFVALLRGVNVAAGSKMLMRDLRAIAEDLGLRSPRTFIASGNLLFTSDMAADQIRERLRQRLEEQFGRAVGVIVRTAGELESIQRCNPFSETAGNRVLVFFMNQEPPADLLSTVRNKADDERVIVGAREVYVAYGESGIGRSRLRIPVAEAGTARNMNTVAKLAIMARELA